MSKRHREALAHLLYGVSGDGGFVLLTGEVGTGKTTISRSLLQQLPEQTDVAFILNPYQSTIELLATICDELGIAYISDEPTSKELIELLHHYLLSNHARGRNTVLMIDEAQLLPFQTLEQIRLLTNLETSSKKLLQIILIGQPELKTVLSRPELSQLAQRITARYHIGVMTQAEVKAYIVHRLQVAGSQSAGSLFPDRVVAEIYRLSNGVPRVVNVLCDRALLGTYSQHRLVVDKPTLKLAAKEVLGEESVVAKQRQNNRRMIPRRLAVAGLILVVLPLAWWLKPLLLQRLLEREPSVASPMITVPPMPQVEETVPEVTPQLQLLSVIQQPATELAAQQDQPVDFWRGDFARQLQRLVNISGLAQLSHGTDCQGLPADLACLPLSMTSWSSVKELNRPLLLRQQSVIGDDRRKPVADSKLALLLAIDGNRATLMVAGQPVTVSLLELGEQWGGEAVAVWRKPAAFDVAVGYGSQGAMVAWLATAFASIDQQSIPLADQHFNRALEQRVKLFQRYNQLHDDGMVGVNTLLKINQQLYRPRLLNQQPAADNTVVPSSVSVPVLTQQGQG
ncbi:ExeA family protein [Sinobacterium norvegicum]|nr:AAA family ATPase [Sinobacterium norvegicum]